MTKIAILFGAAIVVSILLGYNIGKKRGYVKGWSAGNESAWNFWKRNLPKGVYNAVMMPVFDKLLKEIYNEDEE